MNSLKSDVGLLDLMLDDMSRAPAIFKPTKFWAMASPQIIEDLRRRGFDDFRRHPSAARFYAPTYCHEALLRYRKLLDTISKSMPRVASLLDCLTSKERALFDYRVFTYFCRRDRLSLQNASESTIGKPREQFVFDNQRFSKTSLNYLRGLAFLSDNSDMMDRRLRNVLEIGGGYGSLGEIVLQCEREAFYVNVDIPPLAYVATRYLQEVFGGDAVLGYEETRGWPEIRLDQVRGSYRAAVLCSWQIPKLVGSFDLFVNFISFQEMEPSVVEMYAEHVNRLKAEWLLIRNSVTGKEIAKKPRQLGVTEPVTKESYLRFFETYKFVSGDSRLFGEETGDFRSEVMIFRRKD